VWIFQIAQNLTVSSSARVILSGGAVAGNIFWQVAGQTTLGTNAVFNGNILDQTSIVLNTGATLTGRALAQSAVTLDANTVVVPTTTTTAATPAVPATPTTPTTSVTTVTQTTAVAAFVLSSSQVQSILDVLASFNADAAVIENVRLSLRGADTGSVTSTAVRVFKENLTVGSLGSEVKALQEYLNAHGFTVATNGAGSIGNETTTFGPATKAALIRYQKAKNITPAIGFFGPLTRAAISTGR
jgi:peptidoglycan hydrolase-like protein with peptidoglycan-binding domain